MVFLSFLLFFPVVFCFFVDERWLEVGETPDFFKMPGRWVLIR